MSATRKPVQMQPGVLVHPTVDRRLAAEQWLLATLPEHKRAQARMEWDRQDVAFLRLGTLMSAVRIPERIVHTVARTDDPGMVAQFLGAAFDEGPIICDPSQRWFYALVPGSMPARWHKAAAAWQTDLGVACLGRDYMIGAPRLDCVGRNPLTRMPYWTAPMTSAGVLCEPMAVARLISAAARRLAGEQEA